MGLETVGLIQKQEYQRTLNDVLFFRRKLIKKIPNKIRSFMCMCIYQIHLAII